MKITYTVVPVEEIGWTCPHCKDYARSLPTAVEHLMQSHYECWSCAAERMMIDQILSDGGAVWRQTPSMSLLDSRA